MNKEHVLFHVREAQEQLATTVRDLSTDDEYEYGDFVVDMSHLYHHVNTAWNGRDASPESVEACTQEHFDAWRQFPSEQELLLSKTDDS